MNVRKQKPRQEMNQRRVLCSAGGLSGHRQPVSPAPASPRAAAPRPPRQPHVGCEEVPLTGIYFALSNARFKMAAAGLSVIRVRCQRPLAS